MTRNELNEMIVGYEALEHQDEIKFHNLSKEIAVLQKSQQDLVISATEMRGAHKDLSRVTLTYPELKDMMSPNTIAKAIRTLENNGWIKKAYQGGLFGGANKYQFIGTYKDYFYNKGRFKL